MEVAKPKPKPQEEIKEASPDEVYRDLEHFLRSQKKRVRKSKSIIDEVAPLIPHLGQDPITGERVKLTRERFSQSAMMTLRREYRANRHWSKDHIKQLSDRLEYPEEKIYKWFNGKVNSARRRKRS